MLTETIFRKSIIKEWGKTPLGNVYTPLYKSEVKNNKLYLYYIAIDSL